MKNALTKNCCFVNDNEDQWSICVQMCDENPTNLLFLAQNDGKMLLQRNEHHKKVLG